MPAQPRHALAGPASPRWTETLRDGRHVLVRPIERQDARAERDFLESLPTTFRRDRFSGQISSPSETLVEALPEFDYASNMALVAVTREDGRDRIVGVCCYAVCPGSDDCEAAVAVVDTWQGQGLGTAMMHHLVEVARERGLRCMRCVDSAENVEMRDLARHLGFHVNPCEGDRSLVVHSLQFQEWESP